jgi:hypothetical protein
MGETKDIGLINKESLQWGIWGVSRLVLGGGGLALTHTFSIFILRA